VNTFSKEEVQMEREIRGMRAKTAPPRCVVTGRMIILQVYLAGGLRKRVRNLGEKVRFI